MLRENLQDLVFSDEYLNDTKNTIHKRKNDKFDFIKIKNLLCKRYS